MARHGRDVVARRARQGSKPAHENAWPSYYAEYFLLYRLPLMPVAYRSTVERLADETVARGWIPAFHALLVPELFQNISHTYAEPLVFAGEERLADVVDGQAFGPGVLEQADYQLCDVDVAAAALPPRRTAHVTP